MGLVLVEVCIKFYKVMNVCGWKIKELGIEFIV